MTSSALIQLRIASHKRGNRGERIFFQPDDYALYEDWLTQSCRRLGVACWAYCLTPNHIHLILAPDDGGGLAPALSRGRQRDAGFADARARRLLDADAPGRDRRLVALPGAANHHRRRIDVDDGAAMSASGKEAERPPMAGADIEHRVGRSGIEQLDRAPRRPRRPA